MTIMIIIGMSLVTIIPRVLPAYLVDRITFPDWVNRWLHAVPYACLGALIFPGILNVQPDQPHVGLIGGLVAIILAFLSLNILLVVIGAIVTVLFII